MPKKDSPSWTTRIGGNRTIVLGIMILMLCLFTVEDYILKAVGIAAPTSDFVQFSVHGRPVILDAGKYQSEIQDWQRFQGGLAMLTRDPRTGERQEPRAGEQEFLTDLIMTELAKDAGVVITDETLREFLESHPLFSDESGNFDPATFDERRQKVFGGISSRGLEEEFRRLLLLSHYKRVYANTFLSVTDDEAFRRWKGDHPRLEVAYAWAPTAPLRAAMKPEEAKAEEVEALWKDEKVQKRHRTPRKHAFDAAWIVVREVEDRAYVAAREAWKAEAGLTLGPTEAFDYWAARSEHDFRGVVEDAGLLETLRKENEAQVKKEDEEAKKKSADVPKNPMPPQEDAGEQRVVVSTEVAPYGLLDPVEQFRRYWRFRIEKEVWLQKLLDRVRTDFKSPDDSLPAIAAKWSRAGLKVNTHVQKTPIDQYEVEKLPGVGNPNSSLRYTLNSVKEEELGKPHPEVMTWSARSDSLDERGWTIFVPRKIVPDAIPTLEEVRAKLVSEVLDEKARAAARLALETLRRDAEASRKTLEDAAKEKGMETATAGPFHDYTWRPPARKKDGAAPGAKSEDGATLEGWKDPERRLSALMGRYQSFRDTPVGAFSSVLDDSKGTGAYYLAQVKSRTDPVFEEMTQAQIAQARRAIVQERMRVVDAEFTYGRLREKHSLQIAGKAAPEPDESRRR